MVIGKLSGSNFPNASYPSKAISSELPTPTLHVHKHGNGNAPSSFKTVYLSIDRIARYTS